MDGSQVLLNKSGQYAMTRCTMHQTNGSSSNTMLNKMRHSSLCIKCFKMFCTRQVGIFQFTKNMSWGPQWAWSVQDNWNA